MNKYSLRTLTVCIALCTSTLLFFSMQATNPVWEKSPFFNTKELKNIKNTHKSLLKKGFKKVSFTSNAGTKLNGLFLKRKNASNTTVIVTGINTPQEIMAPYFHLLPNSNILLYNRPEVGSYLSWNFLSSLFGYGITNYKNVIAALNFVQEKNKKLPIFILGRSAGSFHTLRTLLKLNKTNTLSKYNIKGCILDSPVLSIQTMIQHTPKRIVQRAYSCSPLLALPARPFAYMIHWLSKLVFWSSTKINLLKNIDKIKQPFLYLYSKKDSWSTDWVKTIQEKQSSKTIKTFKGSYHGTLHLKYKDKYGKYIQRFIEEQESK